MIVELVRADEVATVALVEEAANTTTAMVASTNSNNLKAAKWMNARSISFWSLAIMKSRFLPHPMRYYMEKSLCHNMTLVSPVHVFAFQIDRMWVSDGQCLFDGIELMPAVNC
jgi:hypothetical protein